MEAHRALSAKAAETPRRDEACRPELGPALRAVKGRSFACAGHIDRCSASQPDLCIRFEASVAAGGKKRVLGAIDVETHDVSAPNRVNDAISTSRSYPLPAAKMQLHPRTSTPDPSTVLGDFLNAARCICCTVRVVSLTATRAVVEWGPVPYFTARGRRADFVYYTAERVADLRPELLRTFAGKNEPEEWVRDRLRDSWLVEQLAYWVEFLEEWKFYREWYVFRPELFAGWEPDVQSPGCKGCVKVFRPDGMRRRASSCA
ncbi:hypothetical protein Cob_v008876 [Colletotrichum orbiculare MAFF 240422]|uniref:Uncharacterized protein n=4 Tax=Colletotrichum orbiculare species complex TaxID=2707354 RepID=A0A484FJS0_COLOR|nr:hypothetical protein Cob_v008876 [Colletotrichum orbiculare MAFF 240422]